MVDNSGSSKTQMEAGLSGGLKLEAMMEHLQRQQQARVETEHKERRLREAHIMYAQQVAAQQAILAAARASGAGFMSSGQLSQLSLVSSQSSGRDSDDDDDDDDDEMMEGDEGSEEDERTPSGLEFLRNQTLALQQGAVRLPGRPIASFPDPRGAPSPTVRVKQEPENDLSPAERPSDASPSAHAEWSYDEHFKANGGVSWSDDVDGARGRGEASRDFAKLYELDNDPHRKEFLDDLFTFMQKRGTPVNRIPIMAKQVLDLFMLYKLVTEKGGLVEVINKKIWREITKGLNLPTSITSAAFTLRTQYMKYLYPYECERKALSSPSELQAAIDSNRREGRRPSYSNNLFRFSPAPGSAPHIMTPPKMHLSALGALNGHPGPSLKKGLEDGVSSLLAGRSLALGPQAGLRASTLEHLREKLETEAPERKMIRLAEEQQRLMHQAFQHNLMAMASQNLRLGAPVREEKQDLAMSISSTGAASISVSVEVNGIIYSGTLFAQKSASASASVCVSHAPPARPFSSSAPSQSPTSSSSPKGRSSAEPSTSGSP
ncbi:AT-rich interactive domain-containing protein 3B [Siphateles boraxobius]|uniref:AT-rich interactive domain-containing protein 3B n=1 Tax=Siphateles boraxobius TaxID=180520 RepID=UPI0040644AF2